MTTVHNLGEGTVHVLISSPVLLSLSGFLADELGIYHVVPAQMYTQTEEGVVCPGTPASISQSFQEDIPSLVCEGQ